MCPTARKIELSAGALGSGRQRSAECGGAPRHCNSATRSLTFLCTLSTERTKGISWGTPVKRQLERNSEYIYRAAPNEGLKQQQKRHQQNPPAAASGPASWRRDWNLLAAVHPRASQLMGGKRPHSWRVIWWRSQSPELPLLSGPALMSHPRLRGLAAGPR